MRTNFRALFSFHEKEIALFFTRAITAAQISGLKLLVERNSDPLQRPIEHAKFLIVTSRKVGKACIRNRLRRQLKAIIFENDLGAIPLRFAIICYPQGTQHSYDTLKTFMVETMKRFTN